MRKLIMIMFVLLPMLSFGQLFEHSNSFFSFNSEVDMANLANIGDKPNGYNGVFTGAYRNGAMQMHLRYETFPNLEFTSYGAGGSYVMYHTSRLNTLVGATASLIWRGVENNERGHDPSVSIDIQVEYHWNDIFLYIRNEGRFRGDLTAMYGDNAQPYVYSAFVGLGIKLFKKRS